MEKRRAKHNFSNLVDELHITSFTHSANETLFSKKNPQIKSTFIPATKVQFV